MKDNGLGFGTGANGISMPKKESKISTTGSVPLHPSWVAARMKKESMQKSNVFGGKKVVFD